MGNCCQSKWNVLGTFDRPEIEHDEEYKQYKELYELLKGHKIVSHGYDWLYQCPVCGQYWLKFEEATGHGERNIYQKLTIDEAIAKFPELKDKIGK
jgi:hypothetical protein